MQYDKPLVAAVLIKRYKRFLADVRLDSGEEITVHCANTGAMTGCAVPGSKIWLYESDNSKRKYKYSWELVELSADSFICINTARPNQIVEKALLAGKIDGLQQYQNIRREVKYAERSRVDFYLTQAGMVDVYLEVKSVTLHLQDDLGAFPDAVTIRGQKHLQDLQSMLATGARAVLLFCVLHSSIKEVTVADFIDSRYGELLRAVMIQGVEVYCYSVKMSVSGLVLDKLLPLTLTK
ncbi:MAG: hypothetical protein OFPI_22430 [Osedax symbiont Rs2]|nr:MAG: hypothetical protein OFPI_22430 [Osedax symbiont Rs2]